MSVPKPLRTEAQLEVFNKTMELCKYTIHICSNENIFLPIYRNALTEDIIKTAKDIHIKAWMANNIRVSDKKNAHERFKKEDAHERLKLEKESIMLCEKLLSLIHLAKPLFHLSSKRIGYWGNMILETKGFLKKWRDSDVKRYGESL